MLQTQIKRQVEALTQEYQAAIQLAVLTGKDWEELLQDARTRSQTSVYSSTQILKFEIEKVRLALIENKKAG